MKVYILMRGTIGNNGLLKKMISMANVFASDEAAKRYAEENKKHLPDDQGYFTYTREVIE